MSEQVEMEEIVELPKKIARKEKRNTPYRDQGLFHGRRRIERPGGNPLRCGLAAGLPLDLSHE